MSGNLGLLLWLVLVVGGVGAMQWGAARVSSALDAYRERVGMGGVVAGALLGIATAAPEVSVNAASVALGWPDLDLGAALGSKVPALPPVILIAWLSLRAAERGGVPVVAAAAAGVQAWPYLLVVLLLAALTLPPGWAGLQPVDAALLIAAWPAYFSRALLRPRTVRVEAPPSAGRPPLRAALFGLPAIVLGALAGASVGDVPLYPANLGYLVFALSAWIALNHLRWGQALRLPRLALFLGGYLVYAAAVVWILAR